mgnify:CR=1 FL=1
MVNTGEGIMKEYLLIDLSKIIDSEIKESSYIVGQPVYPSLYENVLNNIIEFCDTERRRIAPYNYIGK